MSSTPTGCSPRSALCSTIPPACGRWRTPRGALAQPDAADRVAVEILAAVAPEGGSRREAVRIAEPLHFIAIGGAGMSGLALVCDRLGYRVSGSDRAESPYLERLRAAGIEPIDRPRRRQPCPPTLRSSSRRRSPTTTSSWSALANAARASSIAATCWRGSARGKRLIAVAGAHGKTTTAGMIAHALGRRRRRSRPSCSAASCRERDRRERRPTPTGGARTGSSPRPTRATAAS